MLDTRVTLYEMLGGAALAAIALAVVFTTLGSPSRVLARSTDIAPKYVHSTSVTWQK